MFVGCSEININVILNMLELSGLFVWLEGLSFSVHVGQKKILGCGLLGGISTQADTMDTYKQEILIFY